MNGEHSRVVLARRHYDVYTQHALNSELAGLHAAHCIVDFANVRTFDATSLGVLVRTFRTLRSENFCDKMILTNLSAHVRHVFQISGLDKVFEVQ